MYAFLAGKLVDSGPPTVVDVGGIGFELLLPERDLHRLPAVGESVRLFTHFLVRDDEHALFGFLAPRPLVVVQKQVGHRVSQEDQAGEDQQWLI